MYPAPRRAHPGTAHDPAGMAERRSPIRRVFGRCRVGDRRSGGSVKMRPPARRRIQNGSATTTGGLINS